MATKFESVEDLNFQEMQFGFAKEAYLRAHGWEHSSSNPMSIWLWEKVVDGKHYTLTTDLALTMQARLEEREQPAGAGEHPDD